MKNLIDKGFFIQYNFVSYMYFVFYFLLYAFLQKSLIIGFYKKIFYNY